MHWNKKKNKPYEAFVLLFNHLEDLHEERGPFTTMEVEDEGWDPVKLV